MAYTLSPNMGLLIPGVGSEAGPDYALDVNNSLTLIDRHDHTLGNGVQITPAGLDINTDLSIQSNDLTDIRGLSLDEQVSPLAGSELNILYDVSGDLYFNDGSGNPIPITQNGAIAGSPGSISDLAPPASASYVSVNTTFVFQSAVDTAANIDVGSVKLRNLDMGSEALTLSPPTLIGDYGITLPPLPAGSTQVITMTTSGVQGTQTYNQVANNRTRATTTDGTDPGVGGIVKSSSSGSFTTTSSSYTNITNLSATLTTSGRPVQLMFVSDGGGTESEIGVSGVADLSTVEVDFQITRDATPVAHYGMIFNSNSLDSTFFVPASSISFVDFASAGTYTYTAQMRRSSNGTAAATNVRLMAYEL